MLNNKVPEWFSTLSAEDMEFIKKFIRSLENIILNRKKNLMTSPKQLS